MVIKASPYLTNQGILKVQLCSPSLTQSILMISGCILPALKRVKRISSRNKSGPFMGSEFAFEDLGSQEVAKYTYKWLHDEEYNSLDCFVLERRPAYEHSGYTRQEVWVDKAEYRIQKVKYYDRKNSLLKTQTFLAVTNNI